MKLLVLHAILVSEKNNLMLQGVLEAADRRIAAVSQTANPQLHRRGTRPFVIVARYGEVKFQRQRLFDPKKLKAGTLHDLLAVGRLV